jgi:hypothetical protein
VTGKDQLLSCSHQQCHWQCGKALYWRVTTFVEQPGGKMRIYGTYSRGPWNEGTSAGRKRFSALVVVVAAAAVGCASSSDSSGNQAKVFSWDAGRYTNPNGAGGAVQGPSTCTGNGFIDPGEECDGMVPQGMTCSTATMGALPTGSLTCVGCKIDHSGCTSNAGPGGGGAGPGTGGMTGSSGTNGNAGASGGGGVSVDPPVNTTKDPKIPPVSGDCPTFANGTVTVAGLGGITLKVGPKSQGTGSLIFYWHGTGSTSGEYQFMMGAAVVNDIVSKGGIIVSPQSSLGSGGDCSGTATFSKDDFKVADQIAACAVQNYGIDPHRIYTSGCSAGGLQAGCMAELRSGYIAAALPNSGGAVFANPLQDPGHVPALMTMHGGSSDMVVVQFSQTSATLDQQFKTAGGFVMNCNHGGGHCGAPADLYAAGWQFLKDHPFGVSPEPYSGALPAGFPSYCQKL